MCEKNIVTSNGKRLFVPTFEFISGEYEQSFEKAFYVAEKTLIRTDWTYRNI